MRAPDSIQAQKGHATETVEGAQGCVEVPRAHPPMALHAPQDDGKVSRLMVATFGAVEGAA